MKPRPTDRATELAAKRAATNAPATDHAPAMRRRDPYRPIGIALAAILVALAGFAVLSSGGDTPIEAGGPAPSQTQAPATPGKEDGGAGGNQDEGGDGHRGNCNGRGNDRCDREGEGQD